MKTLFLLFSGVALLYADLSVEQIEKMVQKIHQKRAGVDIETLASTQEPFLTKEENITIVTEKKEMPQAAKLTLHSILNHKAYINDAWMKVGDKVLGYELKYIGKIGVVLRNGNHIKKLYLRKEKADFIKLEER